MTINNFIQSRAFPWILVALLAAGVILYFIFVTKSPPADHSALIEQLHRVNDSLARANDKMSEDQQLSRLREDSLQNIIRQNDITIWKAQQEKERLINFYRGALIRRDVPAMQKFFSDRYSEKK
jgi:hypothetical protein